MKKRFSSLLIALSVMVFLPSAFAFNTGNFERIANNTISATLSGQISDVDELIRLQKKLMDIGVDACESYAHSSPENATIMQLVIDNAPEMRHMSLDEIERDWIEGRVFREYGIDLYDIDFTSPVHAYIAMVARPAMTFTLLTTYEATNDPALLERVRRELSETLLQVSRLEFY